MKGKTDNAKSPISEIILMASKNISELRSKEIDYKAGSEINKAICGIVNALRVELEHRKLGLEVNCHDFHQQT